MRLKSLPISQLKKYKITIRVVLYILIFLFLFAHEKKKVLSFPKEQTLIDYMEPVQCGVVLTGAPGRIRESFEIFAQKKFKKLIISGVFKDAKLLEIFPHLPYYSEVNPEDIVLEKISGSTYGNAVQSLLVAETLKCDSLLLITTDIHMYRAYKTFLTVFPDKIRIEKYHVTSPVKNSTLIDIYWETVKTMFYDAIIFISIQIVNII